MRGVGGVNTRAKYRGLVSCGAKDSYNKQVRGFFDGEGEGNRVKSELLIVAFQVR